MVGDAVHLKIDEMICNSNHVSEQPIKLDMNFTYEDRFNSPGFGTGEAA